MGWRFILKDNFLLQALSSRQLHCTGCAACYNICPIEALSMQTDQLGFQYPDISPDICVHCDLCLNTCPLLNPLENQNEIKPKCYAVQADDKLRKVSSSGGAFSILAYEILRRGGVVVGAAMNSDLVVRHVMITSIEELQNLRKSKYVQSEIGLIYQKVEERLQSNIEVLFSGTPCQVAGLRTYLGRAYEKLFTIDIFCHGVPSSKMFLDYVEEINDSNDIIAVDFRPSQFGWNQSSQNMLITYNDGTTNKFSYDNSSYEKGFHNGMTLRECCYDCQFAEFPRQGDISLGDFWGIGDKDRILDDNGGTSALLINSSKGEILYRRIAEHFALCKETPLEWLKDNRIHAKRASHPHRSYFNYLYQKESFSKAVQDALEYKFRVGIVGPWMNINCGGALTYYALYETLNSLGYEPIMISQPEGLEWGPDPQFCRYEKFPYPDYAIAPVKRNYAEQREFNNSCDIFIVGSDQLFTGKMMNLLDGYADLEWVEYGKKKIAYAASFAEDSFNGNTVQKERLHFFLKRFDAFSVREESGVNLLKNEFNIHAECVLDPVFLCPSSCWEELSSRGMKRVSSEEYVFGYILDPNKEKEVILQDISAHLHTECYAATDTWNTPETVRQMWSINTLDKIGNEELLAQIKNSKFVVVDSFHGVCFSVIFKKQFAVIINKDRGASRFYSLLNQLGLLDRVWDGNTSIQRLLEKEINYTSVGKKLEARITFSINWLKKAIETPNIFAGVTDYDMACTYCDRTQKFIEKQNKWDRDCLNGRIDWLINRVDEDVINTNQKQWEQLEDHRLRLDGVDAVQKETLATNQKQWEQLEDHRLRLDGIDAVQKEILTTNQKQWGQLEDHRKRLDGFEAKFELQNKIVEQVNEQKALLDKMYSDISYAEEQMIAFQQTIDCLTTQLNKIQESYSYKIGRTMTFLPRRIWKIIKRNR